MVAFSYPTGCWKRAKFGFWSVNQTVYGSGAVSPTVVARATASSGRVVGTWSSATLGVLIT